MKSFEDFCVLGDLKYLTIDQLNSLHKQITEKEQALVQAGTGGGRKQAKFDFLRDLQELQINQLFRILFPDFSLEFWV